MNTTDYLSRQPYLDLLKSIITNQCNNPTGYSFAIDGKWGSGKTWIVNELERQLAADTKKLTFHYTRTTFSSFISFSWKFEMSY